MAAGDHPVTCYKAVRPDGTDWHTGLIGYGAALTSGEVLVPPLPDDDEFPGPGWLHLATVPTGCVGMRWPCRLFAVEPVGEVHCDADHHPHKVGCRAVRVVRELPAHEVFGPQGEAVAAVIDRAARLTLHEVHALSAAWYAARDAAGDAAWDAAGDAARAAARAARAAARDAAWAAAGDAAGDAAGATAREAALALVVADLVGQRGLTQQHIDLLLAPWRAVIGDPLAVAVTG